MQQQLDWKSELLKRLDVLAEKLGTTANYLWHVLVKQGLTEGIILTGLSIVCFVVAYKGYKLLMWSFKEGPSSVKEGSDEWAGRYIFSAIVGTALTIVGICCGLSYMYYGLQWAINPEFYALEKLFETIKTQ